MNDSTYKGKDKIKTPVFLNNNYLFLRGFIYVLITSLIVYLVCTQPVCVSPKFLGYPSICNIFGGN